MSESRSLNCASGTYHPTPFAVWHGDVRLKPAGTGTPHCATIAGSPHAPPSASAGWVLRCDCSATRSGSASTTRWHTAWSSAVSRRVGMLTGSLPHAVTSRTSPSAPADARAPRVIAEVCEPGRVEDRVKSDVDDRARERAGDAVEVLHLGDHQLAELVDVAGLGAHDHVVRTGDVLGEGHALDLGDGAGDLRGLADIGLYEDVCLVDHGCLPRVVGGGRPCGRRGTTYRAVGRPRQVGLPR